MKACARLLALCLILLGILIQLPGRVNVEAPQKSESGRQVEALGGRNGYVLLERPNGKFYIVNLEDQNAYEVQGLPQTREFAAGLL